MEAAGHPGRAGAAPAARICSESCTGFEPSVRELSALYGDELSNEIVLDELGCYLEAVLARGSDHRIDEVCELLEHLAAEPTVGPDAVREQVLRRLSPQLSARARQYLGPLAEAALSEEDG